MNAMKCVAGLLCLSVLMTVSLRAADEKQAKEVVINITGPGGTAKYIKAGDTEQKDVTVTVGQKVTWINGKDNAPHTATSKVGDKVVFETGKLNAGDSKSIEFGEELYKNAGGKDGKDVEVPYFCRIHEGNMKSKIILKAAAKDK